MELAIFIPILPTYSSTFVQAHLDLMPANVHQFYSNPNMGFHPIYVGDHKPLFSDHKLVNLVETGLDMLTGESGIGYYFRKRALRAYLTDNRIEAALIEFGPTGTYLMDTLEKVGVPFVVHFHGLDAYHYKTLRRFDKRYRQMFDKASAIIAVSKHMREQLISIGANPNKVHLNPYGPNENLFTFHSIESNPPVFISTGRFTGKKAPDKTIRAFATCLEQCPDAELWMVADGPLWNKAKEIVAGLGIQDQVKFLGVKTPAEIAELLTRARVFVQHSVRAEDGDSEGTPVSILEAMASGLPIISTRHAGIPDVVIEGSTGFLVDEGDIAGMAEHMILLAKDRDRAVEMGRNSYQRIEDHFTMRRHIDTLWSIIASIASDSSKK